MRVWRLPIVGAIALGAGAIVSSASQQAPPVFRGGAVLVPIDLRVLDRAGQPVVDLKADEIAVFEDDAPQEVKHFSAQPLVIDAGGPGARSARRQPLAASVTPQTHRVFLILLGRGRLQEPSKGIDATLRFVRERLLPQDQVAVFAYDRATAFTNDHAQVADVIERFRTRHLAVEQGLRHFSTGLAAVYGNRDLPSSLRRQIDDIFLSGGGATTRELPPSDVVNAQRVADPSQPALDEFVSSSQQTMQDLGSLYTGIEYLRHLDGEKHLLFVTEQGLNLPRLEDDVSLAAMAADARVSIHPIHTGGVVEPAPPPGAQGAAAQAQTSSALLRQSLAMVTLRTLADLTGGSASMHQYAEDGIDRVNMTTRFSYLVAYTPSNTTWNGRFRRIRVAVNRPDVKVSYRYGYYGRADLRPSDRKQFVTTSRLNAAVGFRRDIRDIAIKASAREAKTGSSGTTIDVTASIAAARLRVESLPHEQVATLVVALVCLDARQRVVGQAVEEVRLRFDETQLRHAREAGVPYTGRVTAPGFVHAVKIVVYDAAADLLGSTVLIVR
jgi:VWFA-related protein